MTAARPSDIPGALPTSAARRTAAARLRDLTRAFICHEIDDPALEELAGELKAMTAAIGAGRARLRSFDEIRREPEAPDVADGTALGHFDQCFVTGDGSPVGLAAAVRRDGDGLILVTSIPRTFEGMPGYAHGGIVAAVFDDLIGLTIGRLHRVSAPTVRVEVDFRRPLPLDQPVEFRTRLTARDGRKQTVTGEAVAGGVVHAEAKGLLVTLQPGSPIGAPGP
jgi:acyl-coenzyme A thioesterase PaaI-like protein